MGLERIVFLRCLLLMPNRPYTQNPNLEKKILKFKMSFSLRSEHSEDLKR